MWATEFVGSKRQRTDADLDDPDDGRAAVYRPPAVKFPLVAGANGEMCQYAWRYLTQLTPDQNMADLALAISRNSECDGGHMGCVFIKPHDAEAAGSSTAPTPPEPMVMSVNYSLFKPGSHQSDVHGEQAAITEAMKAHVSLEGCTVYLTMPPCRSCFALLQCAGVKRIVHRRKCNFPDMLETAKRCGIEMVSTGGEDTREDKISLGRVKILWDEYKAANPERKQLEAARFVEHRAHSKQRRAVKSQRRKAIMDEDVKRKAKELSALINVTLRERRGAANGDADGGGSNDPSDEPYNVIDWDDFVDQDPQP